MTNASQLAFIRTQAEVFAWAAVAATALVEIGMFTQVQADGMRDLAYVLVDAAVDDPKFIGDKLPYEFHREAVQTCDTCGRFDNEG